MAQACDQCRRVPARTHRGSLHQWIGVDVPAGVIVLPGEVPQYSGLYRASANTTNTMQFCTPGCVRSYMLAAEQRILQVQADSIEVLIAGGVLPEEGSS